MAPFRNAKLLALTFAHFSTDLFSGMVSILIAAQTTPLALTEGQVGILALGYSLSASLSQPVFGLLSDNRRAPWLAIAGIFWQISFVAVSGLANNYLVFLILMTASGLGSGAFHPPGASGVPRVTTPADRSSSMSVFMVGGNGGFALGPLIGSLVMTTFGPSGTLLFTFGLIISMPVLLLTLAKVRYEPEQTQDVSSEVSEVVAKQTTPRPIFLPVAAVILLFGVIFFRQAAFQIYNVFLPQLYGVEFGGQLLTSFFVFAALGAFLAGFLADRVGRFTVIIGTLSIAVLFLVLFRNTSGGGLLLVIAGASGFMLNASLPLTLLLGQELFPSKPGLITGVVLGWTFIAGGIGAAVAGNIAEVVGVQQVLSYGIPLMALAAISAIALAGTTRLRDYRAVSAHALM